MDRDFYYDLQFANKILPKKYILYDGFGKEYW